MTRLLLLILAIAAIVGAVAGILNVTLVDFTTTLGELSNGR
jgi:hypothetical protein